jgi:hypothetical protein
VRDTHTIASQQHNPIKAHQHALPLCLLFVCVLVFLCLSTLRQREKEREREREREIAEVFSRCLNTFKTFHRNFLLSQDINFDHINKTDKKLEVTELEV